MVTAATLGTAAALNVLCPARRQERATQLLAALHIALRPPIFRNALWNDVLEPHPDNSILVRYENLVTQPEDVLRDIVTFAQED